MMFTPNENSNSPEFFTFVESVSYLNRSLAKALIVFSSFVMSFYGTVKAF